MHGKGCESKLAFEVTTTLNEQEVCDLQYLVEEEKLARDVYLYALEKYGLQIFRNISSSEQRHMNNVSYLLDIYGIHNPALDLKIGEFSIQELGNLYNKFIRQIDISLIDALKVGATIEDLDIHDIDELIENTTNSHLLTVYDRLNCGSRNHMRGYMMHLYSYKSIYEPQFISNEQFEHILSGPKERCGMRPQIL